jgi:hypothetical protein
MSRTNRIRLLVLMAVLLAGAAVLISYGLDDDDQEVAPAGSHDATEVAQLAARRDPDVPELPFPDNPDPSLCGIPSQWSGETRAWLNGYYQGELVQPVVFLYDSHSRLRITARAPHGAEVNVILYQVNPTVNYYLVKVVGVEGPHEGWIPAPFLSFDPVEPLPAS